jgi:hypothetical protein
MLWKNSNKRVGLCVTVVAGCLILATLWAVLAMSETALAGKPEVLHGSVVFRDNTDDKIQSDGLGPYVHDEDLTEVGLASFFSITVNLKKNAGRIVNVILPDDLDPDYYPAEEILWRLTINKELADFRALPLGRPDLWDGNVLIGQRGKDEACISFGRWPELGASKLTVTRTGVDVWSIESLATDEAVFYRHGPIEYGRAPMPFKITYTGQ